MHFPTPAEVLTRLPLEADEKKFIENSRSLSKGIFLREDRRLILFVGPCSVHNEEEILEYAQLLSNIQEEIKDKIYIIMRFFHEKARSSLGWKGYLSDPDLDGSYDMKKGLLNTRRLMLKLARIKVPIASEIIDPLTIHYFQDLLTWAFIGSRTSTSQVHRSLASSLEIPCGLKNSSDGNLITALNSVLCARSKHTFLNIEKNGKLLLAQSSGNIYSHLVLRGSELGPNFDTVFIEDLHRKMILKNIYSPIILDCAHQNAKKDLTCQKDNFIKIIGELKEDFKIIGIMLESYLLEGSQNLDKHPRYGISITDPCLGWEDTKKLIYYAFEKLSMKA